MTVCPKCKGYGIVGSAVPDILRGRGAIFSSNECDMCHGSGEVEMTNEEYLKSRNTEQLAEAILQQWIHGAYHGVGEFGLTDKEIESSREDIVEWLKQPHKDTK